MSGATPTTYAGIVLCHSLSVLWRPILVGDGGTQFDRSALDPTSAEDLAVDHHATELAIQTKFEPLLAVLLARIEIVLRETNGA